MNKPNFFILGAPKCGTTSLAHWLSLHPNVYMSPVKEPHHFSGDFPVNLDWQDPAAYRSLFAGVEPRHVAIGEASVWYLRSSEAVPRIESEISNARYIVMLRNPVEMAPSLHEQIFYNGQENIEGFEKAWCLGDERDREIKIPAGCPSPKLVQYRQACLLGNQLKRLYKLVGRDRVLPVFLEDVRADPRREWARILEFLNVPYWDELDFRVHNSAKQWRWMWIRSLLLIYNKTRNFLNFPPLGLRLFERAKSLSTKEVARKPLTKEVKQELAKTFGEDIDLLAQLTNRDLSHWKKV